MITAPTQLSGCQVWLDASNRTSLFQLSGGTTAVATNLDPVGYWGDKSTNNRHFTNIGGSATTRPTWVSSLSTVRFDGSNDYLSSFFNITYTAQTVFVVASQRAIVNGYIRLYCQAAAGVIDGTYSPCGIIANSTSYASLIVTGQRCSVTSEGLSSFDIFTSTQSSVSALNFLNGASGSYFGNTINLATTLSRLGVGITNGTTGTVVAGSYFNGDISEVIVYNRALTNNERADVEYYLTRKWNFLNSIPRQTYATKNGLWSDSATWSVSAEPSPWNFPLSADNAYTNTFTVTADSSTKVDTIRNSTLAPNILSGGSFVLANGVSLSANVLGGVAPFTLTLNPAASSTLVGNLSALVGTTATTLSTYGNVSATVFGNVIKVTNSGTVNSIVNSSIGSLTVYGDIDNKGDAACLLNNGSGTNNIFGNVYGSVAAGVGISNTGTNSTFNIVGNVFAPRAGAGSPAGITNYATSTFNLTGNLFGVNGFSTPAFASSAGKLTVLGNTIASTTGPGASFSSTGTIELTGNAVSSNGSSALVSTSTTTPLSVYGNIINAPNGRQAIYAPRYQVFPSASATYTRQAVNGYDSYADYWTSNATFTYPASSDVVLSTIYSNNTLTGSMALPPTSAVALGASVGTTSGAASITLEGLLNQSVATLNTPNSIGARLKNVATTQALSAVANLLDFNN